MNSVPTSLVFAPLVIKPVKTDLPGRIRLRVRNDAFAEVFIRHEGSTRRFAVLDRGDHWEPALDFEQGSNTTIRQ